MLLWLIVGLEGVALAQSAALEPTPQQSSTVVVTAPRPDKQPSANVEARIRKMVARQATMLAPLLNLCSRGLIADLEFKFMCGRTQIQARNKTLGEALAAFEQHDYPLALQQFEAAYSKVGYHDAALMLAHMHFQGLGTPVDTVQGTRWLRTVAEDRFNPMRETMRFNPAKPEATNARIDAAMALARMYQHGGGVERNWDEAEKWLARAAEFGFVPAWNSLAVAYLSADSGHSDVSRAIDYFTRAAKAGYGPAAYNLGNLYDQGRDGVERDPDRARSYFSMAAEAGHPGAALTMARRHASGAPARAADTVAGAADPVAANEAGNDANSEADSVADTEAINALNLALSRLATQPADAEASDNLRRAADQLNLIANAVADSHEPTGDIMFVVRVTGLRAVPWKSYGAMRAAVTAYEKYQALAPDAVFRFAVMPPVGMRLPPKFSLRVRTEQGQEYPVRLEHGELFTLPLLPDLQGEADLVSNFKGGALRIGLLVHTRTVAPDKLRLGDLRLRNEIISAILMYDEPGEYDTQCNRKGRGSRCKRPSKEIWHRPWTATSGAWITEGRHRTPLLANDDGDDRMYRMPIASKQWGNDALIEFDYQTASQRPRQLFEAAIYNGND